MHKEYYSYIEHLSKKIVLLLLPERIITYEAAKTANFSLVHSRDDSRFSSSVYTKLWKDVSYSSVESLK